MSICIIIPSYNHSKFAKKMLASLAAYQLSVVIVDDGSDLCHRKILSNACKEYDWANLISLAENQGKGAAVKEGLQWACDRKFTHAIQIDADGQHDVLDMPKFIKASGEHPDAVINGVPEYDSCVPKGRYYGRKITNFWVAIETMSRQLTDAMCGYRVYPVERTLHVMKQFSINQRMGFDIEILVRLYWSGVDIVSQKTKVIYPEDGVSHFHMLADNLAISATHTRLFFGMLKRAPKLIWRNFTRKRTRTVHWAALSERGCYLGIRFTLFIYKALGRRVTKGLLYIIVFYFYLFAKKARSASKLYLSRLAKITGEKYSGFAHFYTFAQSAIDKLAVWNYDITAQDVCFPESNYLFSPRGGKRGGVILTGHMGNIEIARCLSLLDDNFKINAVVFNDHAKNFNDALKKVNPDYNLNVIPVAEMDASLAIVLQEKIDQGEFIVIMADRISVSNPGRSLAVPFLNELANIPQGPFILAGILHCPVYSMFCLKETDGRFKIMMKPFADQIDIARAKRQANLYQYASQYAKLLEQYCLAYPLQWFNFFDFWCEDNTSEVKDLQKLRISK
jgi:predicted LPLAT superfamily acyltransferase